MREIDDMIYQCDNKQKKVILLKLKALNTLALTFMQQGVKYELQYKKLQQTDYWKQAKELIKEYKLIEGPLTCDICKQPIDKQWTLHHETYNNDNYFTPLFVQCIHQQCHTPQIHAGIKKRTRSKK